MVPEAFLNVAAVCVREENGEHVMVNNWSNGWWLETASSISRQASSKSDQMPDPDLIGADTVMPDAPQRTIVLFFLPQILEWIGFALLPVPFIFFLISTRKS